MGLKESGEAKRDGSGASVLRTVQGHGPEGSGSQALVCSGALSGSTALLCSGKADTAGGNKGTPRAFPKVEWHGSTVEEAVRWRGQGGLQRCYLLELYPQR